LDYFWAAVVSAAGALVVSAGAVSVADSPAFFFAQPLIVTTATDMQSINTIRATNFFTIFHLLGYHLII
jgi:hypothetical protein